MIFIPLVVAAATELIMIVLLASRAPAASEQAVLPLHYNIYFGIDFVGPWYSIFASALLGLVAFIVNAVVILLTYERSRLFSYFFAVGTVALELILLIGAIFIALLIV
ncbi:hypothetical protein HY478_00505 [Candidatus Uhrbacteria bacterium]|nr:hypothetical protein [Candidatus Uhrbacteria bacterium]